MTPPGVIDDTTAHDAASGSDAADLDGIASHPSAHRGGPDHQAQPGAPDDGHALDGIEASPDLLGPYAGGGRNPSGGRTLNRMPLRVIGGGLALALFAMGYTVMARQKPHDHNTAAGSTPAAGSTGPKGPPKAADVPVLPGSDEGAPDGGSLAPQLAPRGAGAFTDGTRALAPDEVAGVRRPGVAGQAGTATDGLSGGFDPNVGANAPDGTSASAFRDPKGDAAAWDRYRQEQAAVEQARRQAATQALTAGPAVDFAHAGAGQGASDPTATTANVAGAGGSSATPDPSVLLREVGAEAAALRAQTIAASGGGAAARATGIAGPANEAASASSNAAGFLRPAANLVARTSRLDPDADFVLQAGTVIPAVLVAGISSDLPGQAIAQVSEPVYDGYAGRVVVIPQGARLLGTYATNVGAGQQRVQVAWRRVLFPDGTALDLGDMPGTDQAGTSGFRDQVDNHWRQTFGTALLMSAFSAGVQLSQPRQTSIYPTPSQVATGEMGRQLGEFGQEVARKGLNLQPRLEIRPGYRFTVMVTRDLPLRPWVPGAAGAGAPGAATLGRGPGR